MAWRYHGSHYRIIPVKQRLSVVLSLALVAGLLLAGCHPATTADSTSTPAPTLTAWPTLQPAFTPDTTLIQTPQDNALGPEIVDKFRVALHESLVSAFPMPGKVGIPLRIEVIVLNGNPDPAIAIRNERGDTLVFANAAGPGQPEVIGQFLFSADAYYELDLSTVKGEGEVGVSIFQLPPAELEAGGEFTASAQELRGTMTHPASYHTFRLPLERGKRTDLGAQALTEGLDLLFRVYAPDGTEVAARDDNLGIDPYLWNFMPTQTGVYTVVLSNYDENGGDYALRATPSTSAGEAELGRRAELQLEGNPRRSTWLTLNGRTLDGISIEARPLDEGVDPTIAVYDRYGNRLIAANEAGVDAREVLNIVQFPYDGEYQVEFATLGETGRIEYLIQSRSQVEIDEAGPIVPGGFGQRGTIGAAGSLYVWLFEAEGGELVGIDVGATGGTRLDLAFDLYSPDGYLLASRDDVVGLDPVLDRLELPVSGRYALAIRNKNGSTGTYAVYVTTPGLPGTPQPLENSSR